MNSRLEKCFTCMTSFNQCQEAGSSRPFYSWEGRGPQRSGGLIPTALDKARIETQLVSRDL